MPRLSPQRDCRDTYSRNTGKNIPLEVKTLYRGCKALVERKADADVGKTKEEAAGADMKHIIWRLFAVAVVFELLLIAYYAFS